MQYHYTDRLSGAEILQDGRIRAQPLTLYKAMDGKAAGRAGFETPPVVWLTENPILELTVYIKLTHMGWPDRLVNDLWRFVLPENYAPLNLEHFSIQHRIDRSWWKWVLYSAELADVNPAHWRLLGKPIPLADCTAVEVLTGYTEDLLPIWTPRVP